MNTTLPSAPSWVPSAQRLLTIADVSVLPNELPTGPARYELDNGRLVVMPPAGDIHGESELRIGSELLSQGERRGHGRARCGDVGIILRRNPDRLVGADALFISKDRLPIRTSKEGYLETIPDLIVEVRSKNDRINELAEKANEYLQAGARVVWILDPSNQTVTEYRQDKPARVVDSRDALTVEDIIPGFNVLVSSLF